MEKPALMLSAVYPRVLCNAMLNRGYDVNPWLNAAGIKPGDFFRPDASLSVNQFERLIASMEMATGLGNLGVITGMDVRLTSHGPIGFAMVSAPTNRETVELLARFYRMLNPLHSMVLREEGAVASLEWRRNTIIPPRSRNVLEEAIAVSAYLQLTAIAHTLRARLDIRLSIPSPAHVGDYAQFKEARFTFADPDVDGVIAYFDRKILDIANPLADAASVKFAEEICEHKVAELDNTVGWGEWVARALRSADSTRLTRTELAKLLNVSPRTLERSLTREGVSFKEIYERVGHERACEMLSERKMSISDVADRLGYGDMGGFCRAFKRRSGMTPSQFIDQARS